MGRRAKTEHMIQHTSKQQRERSVCNELFSNISMDLSFSVKLPPRSEAWVLPACQTISNTRLRVVIGRPFLTIASARRVSEKKDATLPHEWCSVRTKSAYVELERKLYHPDGTHLPLLFKLFRGVRLLRPHAVVLVSEALLRYLLLPGQNAPLGLPQLA